jgi:hypothetical protein
MKAKSARRPLRVKRALQSCSRRLQEEPNLKKVGGQYSVIVCSGQYFRGGGLGVVTRQRSGKGWIRRVKRVEQGREVDL